MSFYEQRILPHLIDKACSMGQVMKLRAQSVPLCEGVVLEVGMGSAINLPFYQPDKVTKIFGLEPSLGMRRKASSNLANTAIPVEWLDLPGEQVPLEDNSIDTVLLTFTLCTIPDATAALAQMHRVLKPGGKLVFLEHGESCDHSIKTWQHRLTPGWKKLAGGCHLNRAIDRLITSAHFTIEHMDTQYIPKTPRIAGYVYQGVARPN